MHRNIHFIKIMLLALIVLCGCSKERKLDGDFTVVINGTVSVAATGEPLEGVQITFKAIDTNRSKELISRNIYTDSNGSYMIESEGFNSPLKCIIDVTHPDYNSIMKTILVNWNSSSYDDETNTFFVNECDFHLEK